MKNLGGTVKEVLDSDCSEVIKVYVKALEAAYKDDVWDEDEGYFGGDFFLVESESDFAQIEGTTLGKMDLNALDGFCVTLDKAPAGFDVKEDLGDFVVLCLCNNNAGGPSYFIPKELVNDNVRNSKGFDD